MSADQKLDISTFLLSSIHDMKNSLGAMAAYLEDALAAPGAVDDPARQKTAQALYESQRVNNHLIQLLALYKIDQAFYPFDPQERPLVDLAHEALARALPLADSKGIQLDCDCPDDLYGWLDYELVFGVVVQALHNALRYSRSRVLLTVAGPSQNGNGAASGGDERERAWGLSTPVAAQDSGVVIQVEDDGPGFPDFLLAQGNAETTQQRGISFETGSTGLGLYFADVVARLHQAGEQTGRIQLSNGGRLGGGGFSLYLP
jgi:signal transduction histidine kinase